MPEDADFSEKVLNDLFEQLGKTVEQEDEYIVQALKKKTFPKLDEQED